MENLEFIAENGAQSQNSGGGLENGVERCAYWEGCKSYCMGYRTGCQDYATAAERKRLEGPAKTASNASKREKTLNTPKIGIPNGGDYHAEAVEISQLQK